MDVSSFRLAKKEHLKSRKNIQMLFRSGKAFSVFPFRIIYQAYRSPENCCKVGFTVSSRKFKRAVDRNRIKRMMRESYRLQKNELLPLLSEHELGLRIFFIYTGNKLPFSPFLYQKMGKSLNKLSQRLFTVKVTDEKDK